MRAAKEETYIVEEPVFLPVGENSRLAQSPVLAHLEQNLFRVRSHRYEEKCGESLRIIHWQHQGRTYLCGMEIVTFDAGKKLSLS